MLRVAASRASTWTIIAWAAAITLAQGAPTTPPAPEYRGLWVDSWHRGIKSETEVRQLVKDARAANFNAIFAQVRRRADAFYNTPLVPRAADTNIVPADFDCLQALLKAAHDTSTGPRLEVHAWLVMYPASGLARPTNSTHVFNAHQDWLSQTDLGAQFDGVERGYWLDPGHPKVQAHLFDVVTDLTTRYAVDGVCFDYLRYPGNEWGYNPTAVERFNYLHGKKTTPNRDDPEWTKYRRDQVSALLRKIYLTLAETHPQVNVSAVGMAFSPAIDSEVPWTGTGPYIRALQDWRAWAEEGIVDTSIPLVFFKSDTPAQLQSFANWSEFAKNNAYRRHMLIGTGNYSNRLFDGLARARSVLEPSTTGNRAHGILWYSYYKPASDATKWAQVAATLAGGDAGERPLFPKPAPTPPMTWKTTPSHGHLKGCARAAGSNAALDGATVRIAGPEERGTVTDATGFYGFVDLKPGDYALVCEANGFLPATNRIVLKPGKPLNTDVALKRQE